MTRSAKNPANTGIEARSRLWESNPRPTHYEAVPLAQELAFSLRLKAIEREERQQLAAVCGCSGTHRGRAARRRNVA
jgi:hypothetical protein